MNNNMPVTLEKVQTVPFNMNEQGSIRFHHTRVSLDSVIYAYRDGATPADIVDMYDTLHLADVHAAIAYYYSLA